MLSLGAVTVLALAAGQPDTKTVRLIYVRENGVEACPVEQQLRGAVADRLGYDPFEPAAGSTLLARVSKTASGFTAAIELIDEAGVSRGKRELTTDGESCDEMARAMALSMSIAIDPELAALGVDPPPSAPAAGAFETSAPPEPEPGPTPEAPPIRAAPTPQPAVDEPAEPAPPSRTRVGVSLAGLAMAGVAPGLAYGGALALQGRRGSWSLAVGGRLLHAPARLVDRITQLELTLAAAELDACLHHSLLEYCVLGLAGASWVGASGIAQPDSDAGAFGGLGLRFGVLAPVSTSLALFLRLEGVAVLAPVHPQVDGQDVWAAPGVAGSLAAGARADFW